ncbi:MAG: malto-oligosyltrehalose synthase [Candidatus Aminicenantes bacterium]
MRIPEATYRIQFNSGFNFSHAKRIIPYFKELGISDVYASPVFKAKKGSIHGYDVVDSNQINPELGGMAGLKKLFAETEKYQMGWIQDIVPNHMAFHPQNRMLMDVLEKGKSSPYFSFFDIDWNHPYESLRGRVLAPFLGRFYGECLESGEIRLAFSQGKMSVGYYDLIFPLNIRSYSQIFSHKLNGLQKKISRRSPSLSGFLKLVDDLKNRKLAKKDLYQQERIKSFPRRLWDLYSKDGEIKNHIQAIIEDFNGKKGRAQSFDLMDNLLSDQFYRLSFWKVATEEINYRRFFNLNELISLRVEEDNVFRYTHALIFRLVKQGSVTGLRVDHVDGLYDPSSYLKRLRERAGGIYVVAEKILDLEEKLPSFWPVQGTTGYHWLNHANGLFCETENAGWFEKIYKNFTGFHKPYLDQVGEKKRLILGKHMAGDVDNLARSVKKISECDRYGRDITLYGLKRALVELMAQFSVYRTYRNHDFFREEDRRYIREALNRAKKNTPELLHELDFLERFLLSGPQEGASEEERTQWLDAVMRFQQCTGPLMAKGFEDTFFYVYNRLLSLNEVGGNPQKFGLLPQEFHGFNQTRSDSWPHAMNATATHDTKRGEDVRARLNVLSEIPREWERAVKTWRRINKRKKRFTGGLETPDKNDEYFFYQTLMGAFPFQESDYPLFLKRMKEYIIKAVREAKVHTAWLKPDEEYEEGYLEFAEGVLHRTKNNAFWKEFLPLQEKVAFYGIFNSLSQTLLKITSPGIPDFYQGTELWDLSLVDPDNRRPVDFIKRMKFLQEIKDGEKKDILGLVSHLLRTKEHGQVKLFLIYRALKARQRKHRLFAEGAYIPLLTGGTHKDHVVAFARYFEHSWAITVVPRLLTSVVKKGEYPFGARIWDDTHVVFPHEFPVGWRDQITDRFIEGGKRLAVGRILTHFPAALLFNQEET